MKPRPPVPIVRRKKATPQPEQQQAPLPTPAVEHVQKQPIPECPLIEAVNCVIPLFQKFASQEHLEIEAKLGKWSQEKFSSGVSRADFFRFHDMLIAYTGWSNCAKLNHWVSMFDYMLSNNIRVTKTHSGNKFIKKTLVHHVTFQAPGKPYDIRVSLKEEKPVEIRLPQEPYMVRVKKRKSFIYKDQWQFDLTIVWTGSDEQDAQSRECAYEVECEYVGPRETSGPDYAYSSLSLLEKMIDFLGRDAGAPVQLIKV